MVEFNAVLWAYSSPSRLASSTPFPWSKIALVSSSITRSSSTASLVVSTLLGVVVRSGTAVFGVAVVSTGGCLDEFACNSSCAFDDRVFFAGGSLSILVGVDAFCSCSCCCCCCCRARRAATALTAERGATRELISSHNTQQKNQIKIKTGQIPYQ